MLTRVPEHDDLVLLVKQDVVEAINAIGWVKAGESFHRHGVSKATVRKVYLWRPRKPGEPVESFNLAKLLDAHSWAVDVLIELETQKAEAEGT